MVSTRWIRRGDPLRDSGDSEITEWLLLAQKEQNEKILAGYLPHDECGVFGVYSNGDWNAASLCRDGLYALQHRGQESCGIAVSDMGVIGGRRGMGLVSEVFRQEPDDLTGQIAISHVRYSTAGKSVVENAQPLIMRYLKGRFAVAHNGNLVNAGEIREELAQGGALFQTTIDSEVIAHLIARERVRHPNIEQAVLHTMEHLRGAYSLLVMRPTKLVAARDPLGFRPLVLGRIGDSWVVASETCALDTVGAEFVRDIEPGEVVRIDARGVESFWENCTGQRRICIFEYIYFARPDSVLDGIEAHASRVTAGRLLARQYPVEADVVIGVPDSGLDAALGLSRESGIPFEMGFVRNNYVGRTFIKPDQSERKKSVNIKLNALAQSVAGKRVIMVDDSIVRGTTSANIVRALKQAGALEVHVRISSPTIHNPCYFGTDIPTREELTSNHHTVDELRRLIGADSLGFLKAESLGELIGEGGAVQKSFCDACFTGDYPIACKG